jgi:hypothetical protein
MTLSRGCSWRQHRQVGCKLCIQHLLGLLSQALRRLQARGSSMYGTFQCTCSFHRHSEMPLCKQQADAAICPQSTCCTCCGTVCIRLIVAQGMAMGVCDVRHAQRNVQRAPSSQQAPAPTRQIAQALRQQPLLACSQ